MQWLIIRSPSITAEHVEYALLGKNQQQDNFSPSGWAQLKPLTKGKRIILLIPTEEVVLNSAKIPASNQKLLAKAVPYALEDQLAEDIDELHFVYHRDTVGADVNISAVNKVRLQQWLDALREYDILPHIILPDLFALPLEAEGATLSIDGKRVLFRDAAMSGFVTDSDLLPVLLPEVINKTEIKKLFIGYADDSAHFNAVDIGIPDDLSVEPMAKLKKICSASLLQALPLNLLNRFSQKGGSSLLKHLSKWKSVAVLTGMIGVLWTVTTGVKNYQLKQQLASLDQGIASVFKKTFPGKPVDTDYRVLHNIMEEKLKSMTNGLEPAVNSPLELLATITPKIKQHKEIKVSTLRFDHQGGLNLSVTAPSLSGLEKFRTNVDSDGIDVQVVSSTSSANKVESTLVIKKEKR